MIQTETINLTKVAAVIAFAVVTAAVVVAAAHLRATHIIGSASWS